MTDGPRASTGAADNQAFLASLLTDPVEQHEFLSHLLTEPLPGPDSVPAPARLRSIHEQQVIALKPFLRRNWVDHSLHFFERAFVLAAVLIFGYWLIDGPVRDWLYARGITVVAAAQEPTAQPTPVLQIPDTAPPAAAPQLPALPFTTPDMAEPEAESPPQSQIAGADFLAPQSMVAPVVQVDPRPLRLVLPSINVDSAVKEVFVVDGAWQVADYAVGYHHGTALPGTIGNTVMAGHAGLRGAVFRDLGDLRPGDEAVIESAGWRYRYRIREMRSVWPTQVEVMAPTSNPTLTLITCTNWDTQRLIVVADLVDAQPLS
ncbi:MAG: sortase [Oscillochloris sp.]|nr:sortase [Oscillochloris sp.]